MLFDETPSDLYGYRQSRRNGKESKGGLVYPIGDISKFQVVVKKMIEMRQVYSENAYQYYLNNLTDEKNYKELVEIYDKSRNIK